jgi:exonuclease VII large subunit
MAAIESDARNALLQKKQWLDALNRSPYLRDPRTPLHQRMQYLDDLQNRLLNSAKHVLPMRMQMYTRQKDALMQQNRQALERYRARLTTLQLQLNMLNPKNILSRGYSIIEKKNQGIVSKTKQVRKNDRVKVTVSDGSFDCEVIT